MASPCQATHSRRIRKSSDQESATRNGNLINDSKIIEVLSTFIIAVISAGDYAGIVLLMAIESACIPLPSEVIMPFSGYLVYTGRFSLFWVATAGAIGCNLGSLIAYYIGYHGGRPLVEKYGHYIFLSEVELGWADRFFDKWGDWAVFVAVFYLLCVPSSRFPRESRR